MPEVIAVGEALVEIMRKEVGIGLDEAADFVGPFPSGAPAIFADQVARLGHSVAFVRAVGDDAFGRMLIKRLRGDGVDVSHLITVDSVATGVAFVTYRHDGSREFIFHIGNAAAGWLPMVPAELITGAKWLHICGSSLAAGEHMRRVCYQAVEDARRAGVRVSFDPNLRPELLPGGAEQFRQLCRPVLDRASLVLPGAEELAVLTGNEDLHGGVQQLLDGGVETVAVKLGAEGCLIASAEGAFRVEGFPVQAVDPTGAGDCFDAGVVCGLIEGLSLEEIAKLANACGALGASAKGPMEGAKWREEVEAFMQAAR